MNGYEKSEELKPCPFCGSENARFKSGEYGVVCSRCKARGSIAPNEEMSLDMWNSRVGGAVVAQVSLDEDKLRQLVDEAMKNVAAEYAQSVKDALKALEYYDERGEPMPAYVCRELADDMKAVDDDYRRRAPRGCGKVAKRVGASRR